MAPGLFLSYLFLSTHSVDCFGVLEYNRRYDAHFVPSSSCSATSLSTNTRQSSSSLSSLSYSSFSFDSWPWTLLDSSCISSSILCEGLVWTSSISTLSFPIHSSLPLSLLWRFLSQWTCQTSCCSSFCRWIVYNYSSAWEGFSSPFIECLYLQEGCLHTFYLPSSLFPAVFSLFLHRVHRYIATGIRFNKLRIMSSKKAPLLL